MNTVAKCQKRVIKKIKMLPESRLKATLDFVEYLEEKDELEAIIEVLSNKESIENIKASDDYWEFKKMAKFIPWNEVRKDVQDISTQ